MTVPDPVAGWSAADDAPRVLAPEQRPPGGSRRTNLPGQDMPADARTTAQTNDRAATGAPRTGARSPRSTDSQAGDADARGDPDAPALHPAGSAASDSTSERENLARRPAPPARATANSPAPADASAERPDAETQPETGQGGDTDSSTTEDETRTYDTYEEVVTPNGSGYVVAQSPDGVLVNEGGTYELYPTGRLSRPGEARPPEPVDLARQERRAQDLAAAMSPEGMALHGHDARLARLNLDEGHGEVIDSAGEVIGWIRRRGRTWYGQDARGGTRSSTSWAEDSKGGPLRAAELMASFVVLGTTSDTMPGGQAFRHIRPEEVTSPIFYSMLSEAQTRELRSLAEEWKTVADPDLRTAAEQWSQEVSTAQMRRLATAVDEVAAHTDTTTPQGRRRQGVLQRLAANVRSQAHAAEGAFSTLPPPGEPDPWARSYRPQETQQAAAAPTSAPKETPAQPDTALQMPADLPATVTADEPSEDVADAPQPESTVAPQTIPGVPVASSTPESGRPSPAPMPSRTAPPPLDPSAAPASTATSAPTAPEAASEGARPAPILPGAPAPSGPAAATAETGEETAAPATDFEARGRARLAQIAAAGEVLGIDPSAGESFEGYAGRFDGDYDITLPNGRYCYRTPGFTRKKYSVRYIPDPTSTTNSKQIGTVSRERDIMPMVRRHAARHADQRDPLAVELNEHEQKALDDVARGIISRSLGEWYRHNPQGRGNAPTYDWTTHALWTLSALGLIHVPPVDPDRPKDRFARLSELGERRHAAPRGEPTADTRQPGVQEQTAMFAEPVSAATPELDDQAAAAAESAPSTGETEAALPRFSGERHQALAEIARGTISVVDGVFMLTNPRRPTRQAPSQRHFRTVLDEGLAQDAGGQVRLSERGFNWCTHHNLTLPAVPRDTETVDQAPLPPIDYATLAVLPVPEASGGTPLPPAPAPLPAAWHRRGGGRSEESVEATYAMAAEAAERAARSTARDVADVAAGPDHAYWTYQYPLAQYDENAATALETLADPATHGYATRAVLNLRAALEEAGKEATDHYVQNVRSPQWKTTQGVQADDVHRGRVTGIVVTYLLAVREHAKAYGLDADTIVNVLEDATGWTGELRQLGNAAVKYPQLPAAENVAEAAQYVANALRAYALGQTDTVDTVADRRTTWRTVEPRPVPAASEEPDQQGADVALVEGESLPDSAASPSDHVGPAGAAAGLVPAQVEEGALLDQPAVGPEAPDVEGAGAEATPNTDDGTVVEAGASAPTAADDSTLTQQVAPRDPAQDQAAQAQPEVGEATLEQPTETRTDEGLRKAPLASTPATRSEAGAAQAPPTSITAPSAISPAVPGPVPEDAAPEDGPDTSTLLAETTPAPTGTQEVPGTEPDPTAADAATVAPGDRPGSATPESGIRPPRPSAAVREEGTVATSAQPSEAAAVDPAAPGHTESRDTRLDMDAAEPYPDAATYAAAHEALLTELDQHEQWLSRTPAAEEAATTLAGAGALGLPGLTALLALQAALAPGADDGNQRTRLAQQLGHHIRCAQLTMAKFVLGQAGRSNHAPRLRELHKIAFQGEFIAFVQQTEDGEMELGQYLKHRAQQVPQQPVGTEDPAEETPETAEEATAMAVDPDDDSQMPIFELPPGEVLMSAAEAAPRLQAQAQTHLASGAPGIELLAHIHGRPVYAMVTLDAESVRSLYLGLALPDEEANARTVSIGADHLARVTPEVLLAAVTAWMNASDDGDRPLLDYVPSAAAQMAVAPGPDQGQPAPAEAEQPAPALAPAAPAATTADTTTAPAPPVAEAVAPRNPPGSAEMSAPAAPATVAAPDPGVEAATDGAATPLAEETPKAPGSGTGEEQAAAPISTGASSVHADSAAGPEGTQGQSQDGAEQRETTPAATEQPPPALADPVAQLTALARSALTDLGVTLEATGVLTADHTVVITLETSGNAEQDREVADNLRPALHEAIRQHPEQGLAAYRVDFQHTPQVGQGALQDATGSTAAPVPRERLIAANNAAAKIFTDRLQSDPNAQLARTYLTEERQLPPEVQQEWGLGYAPSDPRAGRWDPLVRALRDQGFTDEELLQAGLATRSRRDTLIDPFRDRIMFAIHDEHGDIVGFSGRRIDRPGETEAQAKERGGPKYFNTSNDAALFSKGDMVFGLHHPAQAQALASSSGPRVSVEGYLDAVAVARATAAVPLEQRPVVGAPMGTAFTERQLTVLRGLDTDNPRSHIVFLDADDSGRKVLLDKWDLLLQAAGETTVTSAPDAKDAAKLWEEGINADGDGASPVLRVLEQRQPLLNAAVEAVLMKNADEGERVNHAFDSAKFFPRTRAIAAQAARYIHQTMQTQAPGDTAALEQAALDWAKRLDQEWSIPGHMTATAVLLGPGKHHEDYENEVYEQALDLLAADPEGYFANDSHVRSRQSATEPAPATAPASPDGTGPAAARPGQWPAGTRASGPVTSTSAPTDEPDPARDELVLSMVLPSPVDGKPVEHTDRTTAAYTLHTAVHERLGQHTTENPEPNRLPQPLKLGTIYGVDLSTSGDDQTNEDPTVVVWLGPSRTDSLRMSYSRLVEMTGPELLAAVEWRAAQAAGLLGAPLSQTWRDAVRSILPPQFPAQPTPAQLADLLDTIAQGPDGSAERTRHRAEQALALYTAGHPDLALNVLAADDHIWVLRNDGSWIQEEAIGTELSWEELDNGFSQESAELDDIAQAAAAQPPGDPAPMPADLTVAHHSAHEALAALRPYSIGLPNTRYEKITDLVAQMDASEPALRRLHGPDGEQLMNRAKTSFIRILEGLATVASKIRLTGLNARLERTVARLRGQDPDTPPAPRAVRTDRRMQDLAHIERDLERRMAAPTTTLAERGELQEQWIINRARWRARYEQLHGQPPGADFLPDNGLVAGAPPVPNLIAAHDLLAERLSARVVELRDTDPHTGEESNPYEPTADLLNGVAWAYQQRLIGIVPTGEDPQGPIPAAQLRQAALTVTSHQNASPLTLRRAMSVTAERADRLLHRLEEQQILGPYRADAPRTVLARPADIDSLLARPATPPALRKPVAEPAPAPAADPAELDEDRIRKMVSKILADQQKRSEPRSGAEQAERTAPAPRARKSAHREAEANALAASQTTPLAPSQP
ncbi:toprim domain-containing protein [Streptomyces sp. NBC_01142]|uniref:toprim domain-containing protein n=1 Tax=Streptomyces sp. NBC_01142 TaxID=2975865 RepID=UPI00225C2C0C|nr:toprim domain-containing protein [Streptomyces sp. NBC_01142]MCX4826425.1 toprim domain-containing protein [Streptomyces sp. NBC_01142]